MNMKNDFGDTPQDSSMIVEFLSFSYVNQVILNVWRLSFEILDTKRYSL
jgi:hypothetical protein